MTPLHPHPLPQGERGRYLVLRQMDILEGDPVRLLHSYFIGDTDITRATGHKELRNLEFRRWITWDEFELKINNQTYRVQYTTAHEFAIRPVKK